MKVGSLVWILPFTLVLAAGCGSDGVPSEDSIDEQTQAYIDEMLAVGEFANVGRRCATPNLSNATAEAIDAIAAGRLVGPATTTPRPSTELGSTPDRGRWRRSR